MLKKLLFNLVLPLLLLSAAFFAASRLGDREQSIDRRDATEESAVPVVTSTLSPTTERVRINSYGTIEAKSLHRITTQVGGRVSYRHSLLAVGAEITKDTLLFRIAPKEYQLLADAERANLARAEFLLTEEQGRGVIAQREWALLDNAQQQNVVSKDMMLREAHLKEKTISLEAARNRLQLAQLNLERSRIKAPCDGFVLDENVRLGMLMAVGAEALRFVCKDVYQVIAEVPQSKMRWLMPLSGLTERRVEVDGVAAKLLRLLPDLDGRSRMVRLLVEIPDPLAAPNPFLLGHFARIHLYGAPLANTYRLPERLLHEGNILYVVTDDNRLRMEAVELVAYLEHEVLVRRLDDRPAVPLRVVSSYIQAPYETMRLAFVQ